MGLAGLYVLWHSNSNREGSLEVDLFADSDGYRIDVSCNANGEGFQRLRSYLNRRTT